MSQKKADEISVEYENDFSVEKLNPDELKTYNFFLKRGIEIGHEEAIKFQEMVSHGEYYPGERWRIWNTNKDKILKLNRVAEKVLNAFPSDVDHPFLIHTRLLSVIGEDFSKFIKSDDSDDEKKSKIRKQLKLNGLTNFNKFSKEYRKFEKLFLKKEMDIFEVNQNFENDPYGGSEYIRYSLDEIINKQNNSFSKNYSPFYESEIFNDNIITKILLDNKIANIGSGGLTFPAGILENINRTVKKKRKEKKVDYQHQCATSLYEYFTLPLFSFTNELGSFLKNIDIYLNNKTVKRHYIFGQSDTIDSPLLDFGDKFLRGNTRNLKFVNKWLKEFGLADELIINKIYTSCEKPKAIIGFYFTIKKGKDGIEIPMSDSGLGVHQILLLLVKLAMVIRGKILLLEEPESNLHPSLQSKLADLFVEASHKLGVKFLIETHSEYLIREMQYLIASGKLLKENLSINYLFDPSTLKEGDTQVKAIKVLNDGRLADRFASGFFDESTILMGKIIKANIKN